MHCGVRAGRLKVRDTLEENKLVNVGIAWWPRLLAGCRDEEGWLCAVSVRDSKAELALFCVPSVKGLVRTVLPR